MMQRVPYMVVVPGMDKGKIIDTYGGQVDMLPTLEHLLALTLKTTFRSAKTCCHLSTSKSQPSAPAITLSLQNTLASTDGPTTPRPVRKLPIQTKPSRKSWMRFVMPPILS